MYGYFLYQLWKKIEKKSINLISNNNYCKIGNQSPNISNKTNNTKKKHKKSSIDTPIELKSSN